MTTIIQRFPASAVAAVSRSTGYRVRGALGRTRDAGSGADRAAGWF